MSDYVPTIDDIRVKVCWICRDEELWNEPEVPPRRWIHPCRCSLIAHESCLLHWIETKASSSSDTAAFKCPQCSAPYAMDRNNPLILQLLEALETLSHKVAYLGVFAGMALGGLSLVSFVVWLLAKYGAYAVEEFFGAETSQLLLTDASAFFQLPLIPISLVFSRFSLKHNSLVSVIPILLNLATAPHLRFLAQSNPSPRVGLDATTSQYQYWPPTPFTFSMIIFPVTRLIYRRAHARVSEWLLGPPQVVQERREDGDGARLIIRIAAGENPPNNDNPRNGPAGEENGEQVQERVITVTALGKQIAGALMIPLISNRMGRLLLYFSRYSIWLRRVLGLPPNLAGATVNSGLGLHIKAWNWASSAWNRNPTPRPQDMGPLGPLGAFLRQLVVGVDLDPTWWRNSVGFGIFVMTKDIVHLYHRYLLKREHDSRRVRSLDFTGIDPSTLDLVGQQLRPQRMSFT
ncbi:hypothetical protein C8J56DRAFT_864188 [Mycena floridula]|nr:hypothetical protein C8J56DRAFT_864188 [Mycena floridula]